MELLIPLSVFMVSLAALSGIFAVGSGKHWKFKLRDYARGKRNAILYLWVIASSAFSILHAGFLTEYLLRFEGQYRLADQWPWFFIHTCTGVLLTVAHLFVRNTLSKEVGPVDKFLWGRRRNAHL